MKIWFTDKERKELMQGNNNPSCPRCDGIVKYSHENEVPEKCPKCFYDLRNPINKWKEFWHNLFWMGQAYYYPLAKHYPDLYDHGEIYELEKQFKIPCKGKE